MRSPLEKAAKNDVSESVSQLYTCARPLPDSSTTRLNNVPLSLLLNTMYFDEEVQKNPVKLNSESGEKELSLARTVINSMSGKFEPTEFKDEYNERLLKAIDGKVKGKEIKSLGGSKPQKTMDLVDALRRSVLLKSEKPSKVGGTVKQVAKGEKIKKRA